MENENMICEEIEVMDDEVVVVDEDAGMSTGTKVLIGAGMLLTVGVGIKYGKKAINGIKAKLAAKKAAAEEDQTEEEA